METNTIAEIGHALMEVVCSYIAPIFWGSALAEGDVEANGTCFFLNTGERTFAVTNDHVIRAALDRVAAEPRTTVQIHNLRIDIRERLIDRDEGLDLATLDIKDDELHQLRRSALRGSQEGWPPDPPMPGRGVSFAGFPGRERERRGRREVSFGSYSLNTVASEVTERVITCQFERKRWIDHLGHGVPEAGYDLGGLSGAPLLALVEHNRILTWRLAGVIYQFHLEDELLVARRADFIRANGRLAT